MVEKNNAVPLKWRKCDAVKKTIINAPETYQDFLYTGALLQAAGALFI